MLWTARVPVDGELDTPRASRGRAAVRTPYPRSVASAPAPTAAFFDLDKTIIAKSSVLAFGRPFYQGGLINRRAVLRSAYAQFMFALAGADADQIERMRAYLTSMCTGWDVAQVREIVSETLHEIIDPIVYDEAVDLIAMHKAAGRDVVIVSTSGRGGRRPRSARCSAPTTSSPRRWSSRTASTPARSAATPTARRRRSPCSRRWPSSAATTSPRSYAYSDSATDVPMLEAVGHPYAVNADRALRKVAAERDWPLLTFSNAVPLRARIAGMRPEHPVISASVVGAGVAAAGLVWYAARAARRHAPERPAPAQLSQTCRPALA